MKRILLAALVALPFSLCASERASAQCCFGLKGGFNVKICASGFLTPYCEKSCDPCGGGCGSSCGYNPGPWYLYWPYGGCYQSGPAFPGWSLENNFQTPAPVPTACNYFPNGGGAAGFGGNAGYGQSAYAFGGYGQAGYGPAANPGMMAGYQGGYGQPTPQPVQPVGYYPPYWYAGGR